MAPGVVKHNRPEGVYFPWTSESLSHILPKIQIYSHRALRAKMSLAALSMTVKKWKQFKCPLTE